MVRKGWGTEVYSKCKKMLQRSERVLLPKGEPQPCRGRSRSLTFAEVVSGLSLYLLLAELFERRGAWAPSLRDSGQIVGFAHPALKRGANKHCAYGAGANAGAGNALPLAGSWRWQ